MLPAVQALFTLVRELASGTSVTQVAASKWLVQRHGLAPLAARAGATQFRDDLARSALAWTRIVAMVEPLVAGLVAAGARVAAIKGLAYAKSIYAHADERPMSDVDLLVPREHHARAQRELERMGFSRVPGALLHHATAWERAGMVVDLHISIMPAGRSRIDLDAVWSRAQPGWPAGADQLEAVDALVFHLAHLARNRLRIPLIHVVDAARLLEHAPTALALERAHAWGVGHAAELALRFCISLLHGDASYPAGWLGPSREELAVFAETPWMKKLAFDVATAGSPRQLGARVLGYAASLIARRSTGA